MKTPLTYDSASHPTLFDYEYNHGANKPASYSVDLSHRSVSPYVTIRVGGGGGKNKKIYQQNGGGGKIDKNMKWDPNVKI